MLVTNSGKLIRIRVHGGEGDSIRVASRKTQGVTLFDVDEGEKVVSVALLNENDEEETDNNNVEN
jgi:DNA gyrase subunit A